MNCPKLNLSPRHMVHEGSKPMYDLTWVYPDGTTRHPKELFCKVPEQGTFIAGDMEYSSVKELCVWKKNGETSIFRDIHGREVLVIVRPFPQLPIEYHIVENRQYRWFYIRLEDSVDVVFQSDDMTELLIVQDHSVVLDHCLGNLEKLNWQQELDETLWQKHSGLPGRTEEQP